MNRRRRGFTLTELLIVLGILVALMALVLPRLLSTRGKADEQTARTQIGLFRGALERYAVDTRGFPDTEEGLIALFEAPGESDSGDSEESSASGWDGPYMEGEGVPLDPWGNEFQYCYPPEKGKSDFPDIWSWGPDKEDGTDDDIGNWTGAKGKGRDSASPGEGGYDKVEGDNFGVDVGSDSGSASGGKRN